MPSVFHRRSCGQEACAPGDPPEVCEGPDQVAQEVAQGWPSM